MSKSPDEKRQELDKFNARMSKEASIKQLRMQWLVSLFEAEGVELPWHVSSVEYVTQYLPAPKKWDEELGYEVTDYDAPQVIDVLATNKILAKVTQHAARLGYKLEKDYNDKTYCHKITLLEDEKSHWDNVTITYQVNRESVCRKVVTGTKHVEKQIIEAHDEDEYGWECEKISFLGMDTSDSD